MWLQYLRRPEEGIVSPGATAAGGCELPNMGT